MRLPDFSSALPRPDAGMDAAERGKLLLRYISSRQPVRGLDFSAAVLRSADLRGAELSGAILRDANLFGADLRGVTLAGAVLERANLQQANAMEADLRNARLAGASLEATKLGMADLRFADLQRARMQYAVLLHADLSQADLRGARLQRSRLRQAKLVQADLRGASLQFADLLMADLSGARIDEAGARQSGWTPADLADLQRRGLEIGEAPPARASDSAQPEEGLLLHLGADVSAMDAALVAAVVGAWRARSPEHTATVGALAARPLRITAAAPEELEALSLLLRERRWAELDLRAWLQPQAIDRLAALVEGRERLELWVSGRLRA